MPIRRFLGVVTGLFLAVSAASVFAGPAVFAAKTDCPPAPTPPSPAQIDAAVRNARDHGALWTIDKDGRRSWLYGTIHVGTLETSMPGPKVAQALRAADTLAIEIDLSTAGTAEAIVAPQTSAGDSAIPPDLVERLKAQARRACVPWERLAATPPMLIATTLAFVAARRDGYDPAYATERTLTRAVRAMNKPVRSLESVAVQREALIGGTRPERVKALELAIATLEQDSVRPTIRVLTKAWLDGDLETVAKVAGGSDDSAELDRAVAGRNADLVVAIDAIHREGKRVFAAVGILHMVGARSLPNALEKLGYTIERVKFDVK